jgi:tetratricopeptide (TPR) repeat protein
MLLAMQSALPGQDAAMLMRQGDDALASGLWEMAALHFNDCLTNRPLTHAEKSQVAIRLAEAWIRDGMPADALALLDQSFVSQHPAAPFWKGQALTGLGRFTDALAAFAPLLENPAAPHRDETALTMASLQLALDHPDAALATLATLTHSADAGLTAKARLQQVSILLDTGRFAESRETMPPTTAVRPGDRPLATFLDAHLLLAEGHPAEAATTFQSLMDEPRGQSLQRFHAAAVGLADALLAQGNPDGATHFLLAFIQDHPDSPLLIDMFQRLLNSLPDTPAPTNLVFERLAQWITPCELTATGAINTLASNASAAWPASSATTISTDRLACALFTRAMGLYRSPLPESRTEARRLFTRLRLEYPRHPLAARALIETARWALDQGEIDRAFSILDSLRENANGPVMRGEAAFLEARTAYSQGNKELAIRLFDEAAKSLADTAAKAARLNAAIIRMAGSNTTTTILTDAPHDPSLGTDLELERALSGTTPAVRKSAIGEFLARHPDHPRVPEARLAAAEAAIVGPEPDLSFARSQLDSLAADPQQSAGVSAPRVAWVRLRIEDLSSNPAAAIASARSFLDTYPGEPAAAEAALLLGRNLYQTHNFNDARLVLEKLAASDDNPARAQAAGLLAARSAALVPTTQSQQEALILFDKVIASNGSVAAIAQLEKARLMIDMNRLAEAAAFLRAWFDSLPPNDPLHLPAGLLLGEAIYAQGSVNPNSLAEALAVYDKLLAHANQYPTVFNRLQYLRGRTLEQIPDEKNPAQKRSKQAFIAYDSVLETTTPPAEWHYFELCGFRALALLEAAGRWPAAIACAKKIASFHGPRAEEAATRASQLQLKHMIWED